MMKSPSSPSDSSSFTDDQSVTKSTSFSQISGSASSSTSSLKAAIYRMPTPASSRSSPFTFEGGKAVRFLKKSSKNFDTFLDACNYAAENGFVINHEVEDWFALIETADKECSKKKLLATLTKPTGNDCYQMTANFRTAIFRAPGEAGKCPFLFEGARIICKPPHEFGTFLDAYNFATMGGFRPESHRVQEWFDLVKEAELTTEDKTLLAVFYKPAY